MSYAMNNWTTIYTCICMSRCFPRSNNTNCIRRRYSARGVIDIASEEHTKKYRECGSREWAARRTEHSSGGSLPRCGSSRSRVRALAGLNYARLAGDFSPEGAGRCVWVVCACVCARWTRSEKSRAVSSVLERAVSIGVQYESYMICQCSWRCSKKIV
jgi:hypothetical protein